MVSAREVRLRWRLRRFRAGATPLGAETLQVGGIHTAYLPRSAELVILAGKGVRRPEAFLAVDVIGSPAALKELGSGPDALATALTRYAGAPVLRHALSRFAFEPVEWVGGRHGFLAVARVGGFGRAVVLGDLMRGRAVVALDRDALAGIVKSVKGSRGRAMIYFPHVRWLLTTAVREGGEVEVPVPAYMRFTKGASPEDAVKNFVWHLLAYGGAHLTIQPEWGGTRVDEAEGFKRFWIPLRYAGGRSLVLWVGREGGGWRVVKAEVRRAPEDRPARFTDYLNIRATPRQVAIINEVLGRLFRHHLKNGLGRAMRADLLEDASRRRGEVDAVLEWLAGRGHVITFARGGRKYVKLTGRAWRKLLKAAKELGMLRK